ncbi:MAG: TIGR00295 family protein [Candidatus Methanoperedens sp.]|nr:TIGR00295 family protein [Candidatus Methanoperedens sp.]
MNKIEAINLLIRSGCSQSVIDHCKIVAGYSREIALNIREKSEKKGIPVEIDIDLVFTGGLLHDIGRSRTHGILHAVEGASIAIKNGLDEKLVHIIERHIGAGIPVDETKDLGLPEKDYLPVTLEEKIVAHADNLIIGNRIATVEEMILNLKRKNLNEKTIHRFIKLNDEISSMLA